MEQTCFCRGLYWALMEDFPLYLFEKNNHPDLGKRHRYWKDPSAKA